MPLPQLPACQREIGLPEAKEAHEHAIASEHDFMPRKRQGLVYTVEPDPFV